MNLSLASYPLRTFRFEYCQNVQSSTLPRKRDYFFQTIFPSGIVYFQVSPAKLVRD